MLSNFRIALKLIYKYVHDDGRVSYPLCFIFSSPVGCKPEQQMMYAGSKLQLVQTVKMSKVFEIRKHGGPNRGVAQGETWLLRLKSPPHPDVWDGRRIAQLVFLGGKHTTCT
ncbi:unnamed protein product [Pleuronectes platessa]|uniref:ADF-H domain-containing protein n=1 Tax=Pleuronectes platessa TaxID=8262 RepID=A0A9N7Y4Y5_PLEPL|nr:unnamed protein product [Pleuronectes platessa]